MRIRTLLALLLALLLTGALAPRCEAATPQTMQELTEQFGLAQLQEALPETARELAREATGQDLSPGQLLTLSPSALLDLVADGLRDGLLRYRRDLFSLLAAVLLCALMACFDEGKTLSTGFGLVGVLCITTVLCRPVLDCVLFASRTVQDCAAFLLAYIPVYTTVVATMGAPATAAVYHAVVLAAGQAVSQLAARLLLPFAQAYLLLSLAGGIGRNKGIMTVSSGVKKLVNWALVLAMTAFTGLLSLQSFLGSAADGAAVKTTKFLVGSFVPVVGSVLTDAISAMQGSLQLIRASVGGFGILAALFTFLPVLLNITVLRGVVAVAGVVGELLAVEQTKGVLAGFSNMLSVMTAIVLSMLTLVVISTAVVLSASGGVAV